MKKNHHLKVCFVLLASVFATLLSCNNESLSQAQEKPAPNSDTLQPRDTIKVIFDSLMVLNVDVPQVIDKTVVDSLCNTQFTKLAKETGGRLKIMVNARFISKEIKHIIESNSADSADVLFMIDKTGSMEDDISNIKRGLQNVIESLQKHEGNRLAIACYGDRNADGADWFSYRDFGTNYSGARTFINAIEVTGGDDFPESVNDAFFEVLKRGFWRSGTKRLIVLVGDAPSLLPPLSKYTIDDVIQKAKEDKISMNFYPILISPYEQEDLGRARRMEEVKMIQAIYPNPTSGLLNIDFVKSGNYTVDVLSAEGKLISSEKAKGTNYNKDLTGLVNGLYLIRVTDYYKNFDNGKVVLMAP